MNGFKVGDKVVCINDKTYFYNSLTLNKTYTIIKVNNGVTIHIFDDNNDNISYLYQRFITLKEFRLRKLKEIYAQI